MSLIQEIYAIFNKQKSTHREVRLVNLHLDREPDGCSKCIL